MRTPPADPRPGGSGFPPITLRAERHHDALAAANRAAPWRDRANAVLGLVAAAALLGFVVACLLRGP